MSAKRGGQTSPLPLQILVSHYLESSIRKAVETATSSAPLTSSSSSAAAVEMSALGRQQQRALLPLLDLVAQMPASAASDILDRVLSYGESDQHKKASPSDVWVLLHPGATQFLYPRQSSSWWRAGPRQSQSQRRPAPDVHKAAIEALARCYYVEKLDVSGMDDFATAQDCNDLRHSCDCREHYLRLVEDSLRRLTNLVSLNVGSLATNGMCRAVAEACPALKELSMCGPCDVTDLGLKYIAGQVQAGGAETNNEKSLAQSGCLRLQLLSMMDVEKVSLQTLVLLLTNLTALRVLEHNHLHEAVWLMHNTARQKLAQDQQPGASSSSGLSLKLTSYTGRGPAQCAAEHLVVLGRACPRLESISLATGFDDTLAALAIDNAFSALQRLCVRRVTSLSDLEPALSAVGEKLTRLELLDCAGFQSGAALHIRKYCPRLQTLALEVDSVAAAEAAEARNAAQPQPQQQSVWVLQNQVNDLQSRLNQLQLTMLDVMDKYGPMERLVELRLRNLSMGSLLILLPFAPNVRILVMKYSLASADATPNLNDELFAKIFKKNTFQHLETLVAWCKSLTAKTADRFLTSCPKLSAMSNLSYWNLSDDDQIRIWREGRDRQPVPVQIEF